eukprot:COSAG01_NODE_4348_length_5116_cov_1.582220_3_plen_250_part_00
MLQLLLSLLQLPHTAAASGNEDGCSSLPTATGAGLVRSSNSSDSSPRFTFGTSLFALTFDSASLALVNVTSCSPSNEGGASQPLPPRRQQGFLWPGQLKPSAANGFSLWQLNYSLGCRAATPGGDQLDALASRSSQRNHSVGRGSDGSRVLTLWWGGIRLAPRNWNHGGYSSDSASSSPTMDVSVTVTMGTEASAAEAALRGSVVVHGAAPVCILSMALPNFERLVLRSRRQVRGPMPHPTPSLDCRSL